MVRAVRWRGRSLVVAALLAALPVHEAFADPPTVAAPARLTDRDRAWHAALIAGAGATYLTIEFAFKQDLTAARCRWCTPLGVDASIRDALVWHDTGTANTISTVTGYVATPVLMTGFLLAASWDRGDWRRWFDDTSPILESAIAVSLLQHVGKFSVAQQRPFVHYAAPGTHVPNNDDNTSFWSGHTSLTFALTVSAGVVADDRGYAIAPAIWITGLTLAGVTGYLRIAADKHYASDVIAGAVMGGVVGYAWPKLFRRDLLAHDVVLSPTPNGLALAGSF